MILADIVEDADHELVDLVDDLLVDALVEHLLIVAEVHLLNLDLGIVVVDPVALVVLARGHFEVDGRVQVHEAVVSPVAEGRDVARVQLREDVGLQAETVGKGQPHGLGHDCLVNIGRLQDVIILRLIYWGRPEVAT